MSTNAIDPPASQLTPTRKPGETQRLQTLCIEIPVTVQGSRNTHASGPFLEETRTVIVFPQGAVVRLSEIVVQGQVVIVQNMRVRQEVACRVISSKPGAAAKGYVELEFMQPAPGFWGISFPGEGIAPRPVVPEMAGETVTRPVASALRAPAAPATPATVVTVTSVTPAGSADRSAGDSAGTSAGTSIGAPAGTATPTSPMNAPAKLTPETTLELNRAIAASFAHLKELVKKTEASESAKPAIEKKEPAAKPVVETRPGPVTETRPSSVYETRTAPVAVAPPAPMAVMPPMSRNAAPPVSAPVNPPVNSPVSSPVNSPAMPQSVARSDSRPQKTSREPATVSLEDSIAPSEADLTAQPRQSTQTGTQTDSSRAARSSEATPSTLLSDSRRESGVASKGLTVLSDLGAAPDSGNQLLSAKAAERSRSGKNRVLLVAAAAIVVAAGAGSYFWYAKTHAGNATASVTASASKNVSSTSGGSGAQNPQPAPVSAPVLETPNARQPNNSAPGNSSSEGSNNRAANNKSNNLPPIVVNSLQRNVLPMKIAAPKAPSRNATPNAVSAPELGNVAPPAGGNAYAAGLGSAISSSMPAAPPPPGGGSATSSASPSVVREAKLISSILPIYPKTAILRGDSGEVTVDLTVNELGKVVLAKAISGPMTLRTAAVDAVNQWRYQPATLDGKPVASHVTVKLIFNPKKD